MRSWNRRPWSRELFNKVLPAEEKIAAFRKDGHVLLRGVVDAEYMARFREAVMAAVGRLANESRPLTERDTYGKAFIQVTNLWEKDEAARPFVLDPRFGRLAAALLGVERVRLYHDQALVKEAGGGGTPWHRDSYYWPLATEKTVTIWMPLTDIGAEMGPMSFASGSHTASDLGDVRISDESDGHFGRVIGERGFPVAPGGAMRAGDCTFHYGGTLHSAGPNTSSLRAREVMTMIYFEDGAAVSEPRHTDQVADLEAFLGGRRPGETADSARNPLVS